jgi:hypothetical protein
MVHVLWIFGDGLASAQPVDLACRRGHRRRPSSRSHVRSFRIGDGGYTRTDTHFCLETLLIFAPDLPALDRMVPLVGSNRPTLRTDRL